MVKSSLVDTWNRYSSIRRDCTMSTEQMWIDKHAQRKREIVSQLEKYMKVRDKSKIEIVNEKINYQIKKLQDELYNINMLLDVI